MSIADQVALVRADVAAACLATGREPAAVRVLAAAKTMPIERIRDALDAGQTLLGENRAQDLRDKAPQLAAHSPPPEWHFIGRLQRNKVKYVVPWATLIHTVDSLDLAEAIANRASAPIGVLVQVNTGNDAAKGGALPEQALDLAASIHALDGIDLRGLMTLPPWTDDPTDSLEHFQTLADLAAEGRARGLPLTELSMGMSRDFHQAIAAGSTMVRIGTAIFGARPAH